VVFTSVLAQQHFHRPCVKTADACTLYVCQFVVLLLPSTSPWQPQYGVIHHMLLLRAVIMVFSSSVWYHQSIILGEGERGLWSSLLLFLTNRSSSEDKSFLNTSVVSFSNLRVSRWFENSHHTILAKQCIAIALPISTSCCAFMHQNVPDRITKTKNHDKQEIFKFFNMIMINNFPTTQYDIAKQSCFRWIVVIYSFIILCSRLAQCRHQIRQCSQ